MKYYDMFWWHLITSIIISAFCSTSLSAQSVDFYTNMDTFEGACIGSSAPALQSDFGGTALGGTLFGACLGPFDANTSNGCYNPGDLAPGFQLESIGPFIGELVVFGAGGSGFPISAVGPGVSTNDLRVNFTQSVNSVCLELITSSFAPIGTVWVIDVYGTGGIIGTSSIILNAATPEFIGIVASENITSVVFRGGNDGAEYLTKLGFDLCTESAVPTLSLWGLLIMNLLFMIIGITYLKKSSIEAC